MTNEPQLTKDIDFSDQYGISDWKGSIETLRGLLSAGTNEDQEAERALQVIVGAIEVQMEEIRELERENSRLKKQAEERKDLEKKLLQAHAQHQRSLGEQLHDSLAQQLYAARMLVWTFLNKEQGGVKDGFGDCERLLTHLEMAENEARSLARGLVPVEFEGADGLIAALEGLVERVCAIWKEVECCFESTDGFSLEDDFAALKLYYIAREAVNNALRHGQPNQIAVRLRAGQRGETILEIEDNGKGIQNGDLKRSSGVGIGLMQHRAELIGAKLEIMPKEKGGTLVRCTVCES